MKDNKLRFCIFIKIVFYLLISENAFAIRLRFLDIDSLRISHEATFQNETFADENFSTDTPPSESKIFLRRALIQTYSEATGKINITEDLSNDRESVKKAISGSFEDGRLVKIFVEPACIEWTFRHLPPIGDIEKIWTPVYNAAEKIGLTPSVYYGGQQSGGGHFHIGGLTDSSNPFVVHSHLLPNLLAFFHNHPSLLFGFSIPFDVNPHRFIKSLNPFQGFNSGTFHGQNQSNFIQAIREWQQSPLKVENKINSYNSNLSRFLNRDLYIYHFGAVNLEHAFNQGLNEKFTVELRSFRPMPSAAHIQAVTHFLAKLLDYLANPEIRVIPMWFSTMEFNAIATPLFVESDWEKIKKMIGYENPLLDELIHEYTRNPHFTIRKSKNKDGWTYRESYAEKSRADEMAEIFRLASAKEPVPQNVEFEGHLVPIKEVKVGNRRYFVGVFDKSVEKSFWDYEPKLITAKNYSQANQIIESIPAGSLLPPEMWIAITKFVLEHYDTHTAAKNLNHLLHTISRWNKNDPNYKKFLLDLLPMSLASDALNTILFELRNQNLSENELLQVIKKLDSIVDEIKDWIARNQSHISSDLEERVSYLNKERDNFIKYRKKNCSAFYRTL